MDALDGTIEDLLGYGEESFGLGVDDSHRDAHRRVADPAIADNSDIHLHHVAVADLAWSPDSMNDLFVDGDANVAREFLVTEESALHTDFLHETGGGSVDFAGGNARCGQIGETIENFRGDLSCAPHFVNFGPAFYRNHTSTSWWKSK